MLALLVVMALPALAQDGGLVIYDNGEWRGLRRSPGSSVRVVPELDGCRRMVGVLVLLA